MSLGTDLLEGAYALGELILEKSPGAAVGFGLQQAMNRGYENYRSHILVQDKINVTPSLIKMDPSTVPGGPIASNLKQTIAKKLKGSSASGDLLRSRGKQQQGNITPEKTTNTASRQPKHSPSVLGKWKEQRGIRQRIYNYQHDIPSNYRYLAARASTWPARKKKYYSKKKYF